MRSGSKKHDDIEPFEDFSEKHDKKKKKDKKDKKKKDKKKKRDSDADEDESLGLFDEENEKKQKMFENITKYLTIEQKKGIVPIVQSLEEGNHAVQKKFEFDLFSLPQDKFLRLEKYVQECMTTNQNKDNSMERKTQSALPEKKAFD